MLLMKAYANFVFIVYSRKCKRSQQKLQPVASTTQPVASAKATGCFCRLVMLLFQTNKYVNKNQKVPSPTIWKFIGILKLYRTVDIVKYMVFVWQTIFWIKKLPEKIYEYFFRQLVICI